MQIVIDIPQEVYDKVLSGDGTGAIWAGYVKNGIPLPEHHGRLIDADKATRSCLEHTGKRSLLIDLAPTVIEADVTDMNVGKKEEQDGKD